MGGEIDVPNDIEIIRMPCGVGLALEAYQSAVLNRFIPNSVFSILLPTNCIGDLCNAWQLVAD